VRRKGRDGEADEGVDLRSGLMAEEMPGNVGGGSYCRNDKSRE
jgi:hypothetical protein